MPACLGASGSVRTSTNIICDLSAVLVQIFWPLITKSSPSSRADVAEAREVAARARLRIALAPDHLAAQRRRRSSAASAPRCRARAASARASRALRVEPARDARAVELLVHDHGREQVGLGAVAAVLLRDRARRSSRARSAARASARAPRGDLHEALGGLGRRGGARETRELRRGTASYCGPYSRFIAHSSRDQCDRRMWGPRGFATLDARWGQVGSS